MLIHEYPAPASALYSCFAGASLGNLGIDDQAKAVAGFRTRRTSSGTGCLESYFTNCSMLRMPLNVSEAESQRYGFELHF